MIPKIFNLPKADKDLTSLWTTGWLQASDYIRSGAVTVWLWLSQAKSGAVTIGTQMLRGANTIPLCIVMACRPLRILYILKDSLKQFPLFFVKR
jgi:hypothetical protein